MSAKKADKNKPSKEEESAPKEAPENKEETPKAAAADDKRAAILEAFQAKSSSDKEDVPSEESPAETKEEHGDTKEEADADKKPADPKEDQKDTKAAAKDKKKPADSKEEPDAAKVEEGSEKKTEESEAEEPEDKTATARQAIMNAFQTQSGGVAVTGTGYPVVAAVPAAKKPLSKKMIAIIAVASVVVVALVIAVIVVAQNNARKREEALQQQYNQEVRAQGQKLAGIYQKLHNLQSAETTLVANINKKATANKQALANWDTTWQNLLTNYDNTTKSVQAYNEAEQAKSGQIIGTEVDYWGWTVNKYYQPKHKDYPSYPTPPAQIRVDFDAEITLAASLADQVEVLRKEVSSETLSSFPFAQKSITDVLDSIALTAGDAKSILTNADLITSVYYQDARGGSDLNKGQGVNTSALATLSVKRTSGLMQNFKQDFETALAQNKLTDKDVGLAPAKKASSGKKSSGTSKK